MARPSGSAKVGTIEVLFEDEHLFIVAKPAGLLVVGAEGRRGPSLIDILSKQVSARVYAVHRLDEDTTGALLVARTPAARDALDAMLRERSVERVYHAALPRVPSPAAGRIESRLEAGRDGVVRSVHGRRGKTAITNYRTLERRDYGALVECRLETGRRNQIRAHLAEIGCPILGDRKYGYRDARRAERIQRPLLHAARLAFRHPMTGQDVEISSEPAEPELRRQSY